MSLAGDIIVVGDALQFGRRRLSVSGVLPSGRHRLFVEAFTESVSLGGSARHTPSFDLEFAVSPVPEPASLLLVGGGLLALAAKRLR